MMSREGYLWRKDGVAGDTPGQESMGQRGEEMSKEEVKMGGGWGGGCSTLAWGCYELRCECVLCS